MISHTAAARCEACDKMGPCEIFGNPSNPRALMLCPDCTKLEIDANTRVMAETQLTMLEKAKEVDNSIRYSGDLFNAETVAIEAVRAEINAEAISEVEKHNKFQSFLAERIETYMAAIKQKDDEKFALVARQQANLQSLRAFGNELRKDLREKFKHNDVNYQPVQIVKTPKITKPKQSPMDRLVEAYAAMHNCSESEARERILKGKG
jgi:hypothetical protein